MRWVSVLVAMCLSAVVVPATWAEQPGTATLSGSVRDETGAEMRDVEITIVNLGTGGRRQSTTGTGGLFTIPLLPPGRYSLTAQREGFTPAEVPDIVLNVDQELVLQLQLKVGAVGETVTVAAAVGRSTTSPAVSTVVDRAFVANLPLNGRSFQTLIQLTPGAVQSTNAAERGQFSINGQRAASNTFTVDGVSANVGVQTSGAPAQGGSGALPAATVLGGSNSMVTLDALEEFSIQTSTYAPEYGRTPGAQVNLITRAGTNDVHGSAFDYYRNSALDANDFFANRAGIPKPESRQHLFGASLGGPIVRNRMFFFGAYEGLRLRQPQTVEMVVPSVETRQRAPSVLRPLFDAYPLPNGPDLGGGTARSTASFTSPTTHDILSVRADGATGRLGLLFARLQHARSDGEQRKATVASNATSAFADSTSVTAGVTSVLSPAWVNAFRYNVTRSTGGSRQRVDQMTGSAPLSLSTLMPPSVDGEGFAIVNFGVGVGALSIGEDLGQAQTQHNVVNTLSWTVGRHVSKFGADYRRSVSTYGTAAEEQYRPTYNFASVAQASSLLLSSGSVNVFARSDLVFTNLALFAQDTWTLSDRFSLTYGLRYDRNPAPSGATPDDQPSTIEGLGDPASIRLAPPGTPLYRTTNGNVAPRIGGVWRLRGASGRETILRGGWGLFYDLGTGVIASAAGAFPRLRTKRLPANTPFPLGELAAAPLPADAPPPYDLVRAFDPDIQLPRVQQFNVTLEQHVGAAQSASVAYVGARGSRLLRQQVLSNVIPTIAQLQLTTNGDRSTYDAVQLQYTRRLSRGIQALASYVWSTSKDTSSTDAGFLPLSDGFAVDRDWGPSDFDVRHALNAAVTWELPSSSPRALLAGWGIDAILAARSGLPFTVTGTRSLSIGFVPARPDVVPGEPVFLEDASAPGGRRVNPAAFRFSSPDGHGTLDRNALRGHPLWQLDVAVRKRVPMGGRVRAVVRAELFNALNRANFALPNATLGLVSAGGEVTPGPMFGLATQSLRTSLNGLSSLYQVGGPRSAQVSLRLEF
jgi:hypothetical protein